MITAQALYGVKVWTLTGTLHKIDFLFLNPFCGGFTLILGVTALLHYPTSIKLQLADSQPDIVLWNILIQLRIHFSIND